jgi:predicted nucleic acid-binding protein
VTPAIVQEALRGVRDHQLPWFDAQMWAAAHLHQVPFLLSEDMAAGAKYDGVTIVDPFATPPAG